MKSLIVIAAVAGMGYITYNALEQKGVDVKDNISKVASLFTLHDDMIKDKALELFRKIIEDDPKFAKYGMNSFSVVVVHVEGNIYSGIADVMWRKNTYKVPFDITYDGSNMLVSTKAGAFSFLVEYEMKLNNCSNYNTNCAGLSLEELLRHDLGPLMDLLRQQ